MSSIDAGWEQAQQQFGAEGLPFPPIPPELVGQGRQLGPWLFGTRPGTPSLYNLDWFVEEIAEQPADFLLFGHAGHGANSWAMHYYLVRGPLALFLQCAWGGAYMDRAKTTQALAHRLALAEQLIQAVEAARLTGRLVVVYSDFYGARWQLTDPGDPAGNEGGAWREGPSALEEALAEIRRRNHPVQSRP